MRPPLARESAAVSNVCIITGRYLSVKWLIYARPEKCTLSVGGFIAKFIVASARHLQRSEKPSMWR